MSVWEAVVLGLVQGAGEFLPVSSSGHLLLLEKLGVGEEDLFFNICLHLGTLLSVIIMMRRPLLSLFRKEHRRTLLFLILACLPTVALALLFKYLAPALIDGAYLPLGFAATSFLLILSEKFSPAENRPLSVKTSVLTGFLQGIAVLPGISRSGATVAAPRCASPGCPALPRRSSLFCSQSPSSSAPRSMRAPSSQSRAGSPMSPFSLSLRASPPRSSRAAPR